MEGNCHRTSKKRAKRSRRQAKQIDVLPDDVLLEIFDFYMIARPSYGGKRGIEAWQSLVHVCRRWRGVVLGSPRRLNLQLYCTRKTPARDKLGVWPALPLIVSDSTPSSSTVNIIAALKQSNRVRQVDLYLARLQLERVLATMEVPFPELTHLTLGFISDDKIPHALTVIPDSFLGGSAPCLRYVDLVGIPFPGLPNLLLSAPHLVSLGLSDIPHSGYISPDAILALLSVSSSLERLSLQFQSPRSHPGLESQSPPPLKRSILPVLGKFHFKGVTEYLEEIVTRIDTPRLCEMHTTFFDEVDFDCPRLVQFINRTPTFGAHNKAHVRFGDGRTSVALLARSSMRTLEIGISWRNPDQQLSSIAQVCNSSFHPLPTVEDLYIERRQWERVSQSQIDAIENTQWLQLLLPFTAVENLYLAWEFVPSIAAALQELVGARITELLPSLQNIFVEGLDSVEPSGPFQENIEQFVTARQLSGHPIVISTWGEDSDSDTE